jgi:RNase P/RNase MRP subunit POP5
MPVRSVRRRYMQFDVVANTTPAEKVIWETIRDSILSIYGSKGLSLIDPNLIKYDEAAKVGIIRCTHDTERFMRASLAMIVCISDTPAAVRVQRMSGTLRTLYRKVGVKETKNPTEM